MDNSALQDFPQLRRKSFGHVDLVYLSVYLYGEVDVNVMWV